MLPPRRVAAAIFGDVLSVGKSTRSQVRGQKWAEDGGGYLVQRGLSSPGARPALSGAAGRSSAPAEALKRRKSLRPGTAAEAALAQVYSAGSERACGLAEVSEDIWINF